jgi:hypothetical protein
MDAAPIVAIVITVLVLIALVAWRAARRRSGIRQEEARYQAAQTRDLAQVAEVEAARQTAEADERAARAERERLAAEQQRLGAEQQRQDAAALLREADQLDPDVDVDLDLDDEAREDDTPPADIDLREEPARSAPPPDGEGRRTERPDAPS